MTSTSGTSSYNTNVRLYTQTVTKAEDGVLADANAIGTLTANTSELNVQGALQGVTNTTDIYSFKVAKTGNSGINLTLTTGLRVQLVTQSGRVVADNGGTTVQQAAFSQWQSGDLSLNGNTTYYMKFSRAAGTARSATVAYSVSLTQGSFTQDYETKAVAPSSSSSTSLASGAQLTNSQATTLLASTLGSSYSSSSAITNISSNISSAVSNLFSTLESIV